MAHTPRRIIGWYERRVERKGLRPRYAAYLILAAWLVAVVVFGAVEHATDPSTFHTVWLGMWGGVETVTTVGYGDVVPASTAGKLVASVLMLGGLSFLAIITESYSNCRRSAPSSRRSRSSSLAIATATSRHDGRVLVKRDNPVGLTVYS